MISEQFIGALNAANIADEKYRKQIKTLRNKAHKAWNNLTIGTSVIETNRINATDRLIRARRDAEMLIRMFDYAAGALDDLEEDIKWISERIEKANEIERENLKEIQAKHARQEKSRKYNERKKAKKAAEQAQV